MKLILTRIEQTPEYTLGQLDVPGLPMLSTIEQPWKNNLKGHSCVPVGTYRLIPHNSPHHPHTWALDNPALNVHAEPSDKWPDARTDCLIHPANWAWQLLGCIAPGLSHTLSPRGMMVRQSQLTFRKIVKILGQDARGHILIIEDNKINEQASQSDASGYLDHAGSVSAISAHARHCYHQTRARGPAIDSGIDARLVRQLGIYAIHEIHRPRSAHTECSGVSQMAAAGVQNRGIQRILRFGGGRKRSATDIPRCFAYRDLFHFVVDCLTGYGGIESDYLETGI